MSRIKQRARIDAQVAKDMDPWRQGEDSLSFAVTKETRRTDKHSFSPPRVIARCALLIDAKALVRERVARGVHTDECGRVITARYSIELNGKVYNTITVGDY